MKKLTALFKKTYGFEPDSIVPLKGDGSDRRIFRVAYGDNSVIGIRSDYRDENVAFLEFSRHFRSEGLNVPEIYAEDLSLGTYIEEDLGDSTLFEWMRALREDHGFTGQIKEMYKSG